MTPSDLHVIITHFNPNRTQSHIRLRKDFLSRYENNGATIYVVELATADRPFEVIDPSNPRHLGLRAPAGQPVPWIKENLWNIGRRRLLPANAEYVACVDGDVEFMNRNWAIDTIAELHHAPVVQMFSECMDAGPSYQAVSTERGSDDFVRHSFAKLYVQNGRQWIPNNGYDKEHCGYAWAYRNSLLNDIDPVNPLIDYSLVGSADWIMACCFIGQVKKSAHGEVNANYLRRVAMFAEKCDQYVKGDLSFIKGLLVHHWHGNKNNRGYTSRWKIVLHTNYDPDRDIKYRSDGLLMFSGRNAKIPLLLRDHMRLRNEDSIDT